MPIVPIALLLAGVAAYFYYVSDGDGPVPDFQPDEPPSPGKTGYKLVDALLPELKKASDKSGIPLGLLVGWIAKESGGKITSAPSALKGERDSERGYFQLTPSESDRLGLDHQRLSTDKFYSINAGLLLIALYMKEVSALGVAAFGSSYFWTLVKLCHTIGSGAVQKIVAAAKEVSAEKTWTTLEDYALNHNQELLSATKHSPSKWFPYVDKVVAVGAPFGMGSTTIVGLGNQFDDIVDPLDCLRKS